MPNLFEPHIIQIQPRSSATLPRQRHERGDLLAVVLRIIHQIAQITDIDTLLDWMRGYVPAQADKWLDEKRRSQLTLTPEDV